MTPLVLIHGFTGSPATFAGLLATVDPARAVLCPWVSGHGGSRFPPTITTFAAEVARLAKAIATWCPRPVHLVGYSLGARLALALSVHHPERVANATLIGVNPGLPTRAARAARAARDRRWIDQLAAGELASFVADWERQPLFASQATLPPGTLAAQREERFGHDPIGLAAALAVLGLGAMPDQLPLLPARRTPLALVVGALDATGLEHAARISAARPDARIHVIPGAGHNVVRECPLAMGPILSEESNP